MAVPPGVVIVRTRRGNAARAVVAAGVGAVLLVALVALVYVGSVPPSRSLAQSGNDEGAPGGSKAAPVVLTGSQRRNARSEIQSLKKEIQDEQAKASKLDARVAQEEKSIKVVVLKAKKMEEEAIKADSEAAAKKKQAAGMVKTSAHLLEQSKVAKKKFVAEETPLETASKLAAHDHSTYRKAELQVAAAVTKMSEKPSDAALAKKVHKLVKEAQRERAHMEKDHQMLTSLERNIASMQVGKAGSYSALLGESVALKKKAGVVAQTAQALGAEAAHLHQQATADVGKAAKEQAGPDKLHDQARALRLRYGAQLSKMSNLETELQGAQRRPTARPAEKAAHTASLSAAASPSPAALKGAGPSKGAGKAEGSSALAQAESKGKARQQFLAGLFSRSWNKVKPGQDRATE